jgi:hypothetical protein
MALGAAPWARRRGWMPWGNAVWCLDTDTDASRCTNKNSLILPLSACSLILEQSEHWTRRWQVTAGGCGEGLVGPSETDRFPSGIGRLVILSSRNLEYRCPLAISMGLELLSKLETPRLRPNCQSLWRQVMRWRHVTGPPSCRDRNCVMATYSTPLYPHSSFASRRRAE